MAHEYVFRGEREPYASSPKEQRDRDAAKREAEELVNREPAAVDEGLSTDAELVEKIGDYQVGGLDSFGVSAVPPSRSQDAPSGEGETGA